MGFFPPSIVAELQRNKWLPKERRKPADVDVKLALKKMQRAFKLKPTGSLDGVTTRLLTQRYCGVPDLVSEQRCAWSREKAQAGINYAIVGAGGNLPPLSEYKELVVLALAEYPKVCNVKLAYVANSKTADVVMKSYRGEPGGVLAYSHLPCGGDRSDYEQSYDNLEQWYYLKPYISPPNGSIGTWHVVLHEWGHMTGLPHGGDWLMRPTYDPRAYSFGKWEIKELVARYGEPVEREPEPTPTDPRTFDRVEVTGNNLQVKIVRGGGTLV